MKNALCKPRRFYPRQALRRLAGDHSKLSPSQDAALRFLARRGRKLGYAMAVFPNVDPTQLLQAETAAAAQAVLANATTRIVLTPAV